MIAKPIVPVSTRRRSAAAVRMASALYERLRVVALPFIMRPHHLNGDPSDDRLDNLELRCRRHNPRGGGLHRGAGGAT
jgi:hypothetical protein